MTMTALKAAAIFAEGGIETGRLLLIEDGRFAGFVTAAEAHSRGIAVQEFPHSFLLPGLFDSHIHGALGHDTMDASPEAIQQALRNLEHYVPAADAARAIGCFVEGPYLTVEHRGAHPTEYLRELSSVEFAELLASGPMKALAVAPEKPGALSFIRQAVQQGVHISLAHSSASYEAAAAAIESGADAAVHTYCGMSPMHHRSPNLLGAALTRDDVYAELIADGIHVSKPAMDILLRCKPADKVILVSDAIAASGLADGDYVLGVEAVHVKDGIPRTESGSLAGSTTTLLAEVRRLICELGREPLAVVHMASLNPSRRFGLEQEIACFAPDAENLGDHGHHVPAGGAGQIVIHPPAVGPEIFRDAGIDAAGVEVQSGVCQGLESLPALLHKTPAVQGVGIHHRHMGEDRPVFFFTVGKAEHPA